MKDSKPVARTPYRGADKTSERLIAHYAGDPAISINDILKIQRKWGPIFKAATSPAAFIDQKYQ